MIIIKNAKGSKFTVSKTGENGEKLNSSQRLATKQSAWKNIWADWQGHYFKNQTIKRPATDYIDVEDRTGKKPVLYRLFGDKRKFKMPEE